MSTLPQKQFAPTVKRYEMPTVEIGDIVWWYTESGAKESMAAVVSAVGHDNICLNVFASNLHNCLLRDGVRHVSDPNHNIAANEGGRWDYTPKEKWRQKMEDRYTLTESK